MSNYSLELLEAETRSDWVRLRTLIVLRWIAIVGQISAIVVALRWFDLDLDLGRCMLAVGALIIANLIAIFVYPENRRLSEREVMWMLIFDISQLSALLYLTGGLHNPFAMLILAPVTISATALRRSATVLVGAIAIAFITFVARFNIPLHTNDQTMMQMPPEFVFGFWIALVIGVVFLGAYASRVASEISTMSKALLATQMALSREQKISDLAGVVAATAHELGTPLATIKLASSELIEDLPAQSAFREDARLIRDQADRCRDILRSMGRAGNDDLFMHQAPLSAVVKEAAEPHMDRGKSIVFHPGDLDPTLTSQPEILRRPEIIHGLRNLIQNAVDFAASMVWVDISWTTNSVSVRIIDDGPGFPNQVIGRLGDPFIRSRKPGADRQNRPGYEGMGLGLFIAKTLLEKSGAELAFANGRDSYSGASIPGQRHGAIVEVLWPLEKIATGEVAAKKRLGRNKPFDP